MNLLRSILSSTIFILLLVGCIENDPVYEYFPGDKIAFSYAVDVNPEYNNEMEDPRINVMDIVLNKEFLRRASELLKKHQWEMICRHYIEGMTDS